MGCGSSGVTWGTVRAEVEGPGNRPGSRFLIQLIPRLGLSPRSAPYPLECRVASPVEVASLAIEAGLAVAATIDAERLHEKGLDLATPLAGERFRWRAKTSSKGLGFDLSSQ